MERGEGRGRGKKINEEGGREEGRERRVGRKEGKEGKEGWEGILERREEKGHMIRQQQQQQEYLRMVLSLFTTLSLSPSLPPSILFVLYLNDFRLNDNNNNI